MAQLNAVFNAFVNNNNHNNAVNDNDDDNADDDNNALNAMNMMRFKLDLNSARVRLTTI